VPNYSLEVASSAQKELDRLDNALFTRIDRKILGLARNPRPPGSKKLKGYCDLWRIRVGDWRVVYVIDDSAALVRVTRVAHRRAIYDR
jgi:mRNA interferase RelE/StbE